MKFKALLALSVLTFAVNGLEGLTPVIDLKV